MQSMLVETLQLPSIFQQFLWGFLGSLAVEIVQIHCLLDTSRRLPLRYTRPIYWLARLLLALTAGGLAVAYDIETPVLALHVGAATPLIVQALAQNLGNLLGAHGQDLRRPPRRPDRSSHHGPKTMASLREPPRRARPRSRSA